MILKNQIRLLLLLFSPTVLDGIYSKPFVKISITTGLAVRDISPCFVLQ